MKIELRRAGAFVFAVVWMMCACATVDAAERPLFTPRGGGEVTSENSWRDYPRPQMVRANWTCLNGVWVFE